MPESNDKSAFECKTDESLVRAVSPADSVEGAVSAPPTPQDEIQELEILLESEKRKTANLQHLVDVFVLQTCDYQTAMEEVVETLTPEFRIRGDAVPERLSRIAGLKRFLRNPDDPDFSKDFSDVDREWSQGELRAYLMSLGWTKADFRVGEIIPQGVKFASNAPLTKNDIRRAKELIASGKISLAAPAKAGTRADQDGANVKGGDAVPGDVR